MRISKDVHENWNKSQNIFKKWQAKLITEKYVKPFTQNAPHRIRKQILHFLIFAISVRVLTFDYLIPVYFQAFTCNERRNLFHMIWWMTIKWTLACSLTELNSDIEKFINEDFKYSLFLHKHADYPLQSFKTMHSIFVGNLM